MSSHSRLSRRVWSVATATIAVVGGIGCADRSEATGLGTPFVSVSTDTIPGTGQLSELQQRRAAWVARGINDYRYQLRISCFCGGVITRPVLIEVRGGVVANVWDLETAKPVTEKILFPTVTSLFDKAIAERSRGGNVSVSYDRAMGIPARLEVGTVANDAGVLYFVGGLIQI